MSETKMKSSLDEVAGFCRILWLHQDFISLQVACPDILSPAKEVAAGEPEKEIYISFSISAVFS